MWNYNFNGINFNQNMVYNLVADNPKDFYNEMHRSSHFLDFARGSDDIDTGESNVNDREDHFTWKQHTSN